MNSCQRFNQNTYDIYPGRLMAGEYPGAPSSDQAKEKLLKFLEVGIDAFLDLTEESELQPYSYLLAELTCNRRITCIYRRMPIEDLSIPKSPQYMSEILAQIDQWLLDGRNIYVHCWGGVGRTGTVVGCYLLKKGYSGSEALEQLAIFWKKMSLDKQKRRPQSPETQLQQNYVLNGSSLFRSN